MVTHGSAHLWSLHSQAGGEFVVSLSYRARPCLKDASRAKKGQPKADFTLHPTRRPP